MDEIELEPEVETWLRSLPRHEFGQATFHIELLRERGPLLSEPYSRQLRGKLREIRFRVNRDQQRITYFIAPGGRIILLTVFRKTRWREQGEAARAGRALQRCLDEGPTAEDS